MTTIAVICPGPPERTPSTYYRFGQYKDLWREQGVELIFVPKQELKGDAFDVLADANLIVNQKCLLSSGYFERIRGLSKPLFFDLDDLIWCRAKRDYSFLTKLKIGRRLSRWARGVNQVICANSFIQSEFCEQTGVRPIIVPMGLDLDIWLSRSDHLSRIQRGLNGSLDDEIVRVGWTGSPEYHWLLRKLEPALIKAQQLEQRLRFSIHSGVDPQLALNYVFIPWQKGNEPDYVKSLDVGLLPMETGSIFSLGKSPIKGLQYMACGAVPIGNFCGASLDFLNPSNSIRVGEDLDSWTEAIVTIARDPKRRAGLQSQCIRYVNDRHSIGSLGGDLLRFMLKD
jgi:glycosyltransferase involved in cell wall biosynthesis